MVNRKKAFVIVGHSNWGKSETLAAITNGNRRRRHFAEGELFNKGRLTKHDFYVRRMSNDDIEESLLEFSKKLNSFVWEQNLIMTLCPNFDSKRSTKEILSNTSKVFDLHFFILKKQFKGDGEISSTEVAELKKYTQAEIEEISGKEDSAIRGLKFTKFIENNI